MNIPPKYEDVVAQLEAERELHKIATETLGQFADENQKLHADLAALREELDLLKPTFESTFDAAQRDRTERDALQQRLTVEERRAGEFKSELAESERKRREFVTAVSVATDQIEAKHSSCVSVPEGYAVVPIKPTKAMREACHIAGKLPVWDAMMAVALKPAADAGLSSSEFTKKPGKSARAPAGLKKDQIVEVFGGGQTQTARVDKTDWRHVEIWRIKP